MQQTPKKIETPHDPGKCPKKHKNAYRTTFGGWYCPDCAHSVTREQLETLKAIVRGLENSPYIVSSKGGESND